MEQALARRTKQRLLVVTSTAITLALVGGTAHADFLSSPSNTPGAITTDVQNDATNNAALTATYVDATVANTVAIGTTLPSTEDPGAQLTVMDPTTPVVQDGALGTAWDVSDPEGGSGDRNVIFQIHSSLNIHDDGYGYSSGGWDIPANQDNFTIKTKVCPANGYKTGEYHWWISTDPAGKNRKGSMHASPCEVPATGQTTVVWTGKLHDLGLTSGQTYYFQMLLMPGCDPHGDAIAHREGEGLVVDQTAQDAFGEYTQSSSDDNDDPTCENWNYQFSMVTT